MNKEKNKYEARARKDNHKMYIDAAVSIPDKR